jgi:hypothetical protein
MTNACMDTYVSFLADSAGLVSTGGSCFDDCAICSN